MLPATTAARMTTAPTIRSIFFTLIQPFSLCVLVGPVMDRVKAILVHDFSG
jgi:hypothetical protein